MEREEALDQSGGGRHPVKREDEEAGLRSKQALAWARRRVVMIIGPGSARLRGKPGKSSEIPMRAGVIANLFRVLVVEQQGPSRKLLTGGWLGDLPFSNPVQKVLLKSQKESRAHLSKISYHLEGGRKPLHKKSSGVVCWK